MQILFLFFALILTACSGTAVYEAEEIELKYNYQLLKLYFYQPDKISNFSEYEGMRVDAMYETLNDTLKGGRYTRYYSPEISQQVIDNIENSPKYYSFGFERKLESDDLGDTGDTLIVSAVYPISPAHDAGLKKHDRLLSANDIPLVGENAKLYELFDNLFSEFTVFKVWRGNDSLTLDVMQKKEIQVPTVYLDSLEGVPFIRVTSFTAQTNDPKGTYQEFKNVLEEIKTANAAIIDLRNNPGGSIYHCTAMAAELSSPDKELIYDVEHYADRNGHGVINTVHHFAGDFSNRKGDGVDIKWVILVNENSASCSERFVAAVKSARSEEKSVVVIGQTTYGKGIGQIYTKTYLDGAAFITFMQTYFPNGETFHRVGIKPDKEVDPKSDDIYIAALDAAQNSDFGLAKRAPINLKNLPIERFAKDIEPGAYKEILFHEWE